MTVRYPKAVDETVVEWYRRAEFTHRNRFALRLVCECLQAGLCALHAERGLFGVTTQ